MNFEDIETDDDLQRISRKVVWQNFERLVAFILEKNEFLVQTNLVLVSNKRRRQFDVVAKKSQRTLLVECKKWAGNRYRLSALKSAIQKHKERSQIYMDSISEIAFPMIVTLIEEDLRIYDGVPIVPIQKLNSFLNELDLSGDGSHASGFADEGPDATGEQ